MEFVQSSDQAAGNLEYAAYYSGSIRSCDRLGETGQRGTHGGVHQRHIEMIRENQRENFPQKSQKPWNHCDSRVFHGAEGGI